MKISMNSASSHASPSHSGSATADSRAPQARAKQKSVDSILFQAAIGMLWLVLSVLLVACVSSVANSQEKTYRQLPLAEAYRLTEPANRKQNKEVYAAIKNGTKAASNAIESGSAEPAITFFQECVLPSMTRTNSESLSTLGEQRTEFIDDFLSDKTTGGARTALLSTVIESMQKLAGAEDFHPAARINAVYVIGLLDSQAAGRNTAAVPSADAFASLANIFSSNQSPDSLKVAAAAGIDRQLQIALAGNASALGAGNISKVASQALSIVNGTASGQDDWSEDLGYWLKKRSTKILGLLGQPGNNGEVVQAMLKTLQLETPKQLWLAYEAMIALGNIDLTTVDAKLTSQASVGVTQFLSAALETQATTAQSSLDSLVYQNILLEDLDLTLKGNDYRDQVLTSNKESIVKGDSPRRDQRGGGSRDAGRGGDDYGDEYSDEYDEGGFDQGGRDGSGGGGGRGGAAAQRRPGAPKVEIPNYQLNRIRSMVKALAYGGKRTLTEGPKNLQSAASAGDQAMIADVVAELNQLIKDSDVGITNLEEEPIEENFDEDEEDPPGNTEQMIDLCSRASSRLAEIARTNAQAAGDGAPAAAAASGDQPNF